MACKHRHIYSFLIIVNSEHTHLLISFWLRFEIQERNDEHYGRNDEHYARNDEDYDKVPREEREEVPIFLVATPLMLNQHILHDIAMQT